ncbi:MucBP domain-containing protein, partial [Streptococcus sp. S784/96/1]|uniref:MucBP domain-containing protein n=1 Tax=Streptococcus sp. S784/96/1 TaxID=2653499 RepID=UPI0013876607
YTTEQKSFEGYEFVKVDETGATPTGKVEEGTKLVTYVYKPVAPDPDLTPEESKGSVVVHYVDETGSPIKSSVVDTPSTSTNTPYDTTDNKPSRITTPGGKTYELVPTKTVGNETGSVVEGTTEITYVYKLVSTPETSVTTVWVTVDGTVLRPREDGTLDKSSFSGYEFVETVVDEEGNTIHIFKPIISTRPETPIKELPATGSVESMLGLTGLALLGTLALANQRRRRN